MLSYRIPRADKHLEADQHLIHIHHYSAAFQVNLLLSSRTSKHHGDSICKTVRLAEIADELIVFENSDLELIV